MGLETTVNWIEDLNENWPLGSDAPSTLDNHDRHIKTALKNQLPNLGAEAVTKTAVEINDLATLTATETLTNKTLTSPVINTSLTGTAIGRGTLVNHSTGQVVATSTDTHLLWDTEQYDTDTIHDTSTNTQRLTVPSGVSLVRVSGFVVFPFNSTGIRALAISKNDETGTYTVPIGSVVLQEPARSSTSHSLLVTSAVLSVSPADYFTLYAYQTSGGNLTLLTQSWFSMEIIK